MNNTADARVGLVLGAGGTPGGFFIRGAMAAISERTRWQPAMCHTMVGTSIGALNAARINPHPIPIPSEVLAAIGELAGTLPIPAVSLADRLIHPGREIIGRAVGRLVPAGKHEPTYPVAAPPFHPGVRVVSCRRSDGTRRITRIVDATDPEAELYASAAVPGWAPPVLLDGVEHVDGAVWSTTNADLISPETHDALIVVAPMVPGSGGSLVERGNRASLLTELQPWQDAAKPVVFVVPSPAGLAQRKNHDAFGSDARNQILP